jgi:hypothetical protein
MISNRLAAIAAVFALLFPLAGSSATPGQGPAGGNDAANLILAYLDTGSRPARLSTPVQPVAETCKDKCAADQDTCFNACPSDPSEGSVCRNTCTETYNACLKGC